MKLMKRFLLVQLFLLTLALPSVAWALDSTGFTPLDVTVASTGGSPVGAVLPWPNSTPPEGWLECNGQSFNAATYPDLQTLLGTNRVPDLRGEFIRGWDHGRGTTDSGRALLSAQGDAIRNIQGMFNPGCNYNVLTAGQTGPFKAEGIRRGYGESAENDYGGRVEFDASLVVPTAPDNRPRNVAMMYIIKAR